MPTLVVVMRGPSAAVFFPDDKLVINDLPTPHGPVQVTYRTRNIKANEVAIFGDMWIEVRGTVPDFEAGIAPLANLGFLALPIIALCTNAAVGHPDIELAFDATKGIVERAFFESYVPPERTIPHSWRIISLKNVLALLDALKQHNRWERLFRSINQYSLALEHWKLGHATMAVAHLWMSVEAMTKVAVEFEFARRGLAAAADLAAAMGVDLKGLDGAVRREVIFAGDAECYSKIMNSSNGLEHGYMGYDDLQTHAEAIRLPAARYIRTAILTLAGVSPEATQSMLSKPYDEPKGHWPLVKYMRGKLIGSGEKLGAGESEYPFLRWNPKIKSCTIEEDRKITMGIDDQFTAELGPDISFQPGRIEVWGPS